MSHSRNPRAYIGDTYHNKSTFSSDTIKGSWDLAEQILHCRSDDIKPVYEVNVCFVAVKSPVIELMRDNLVAMELPEDTMTTFPAIDETWYILSPSLVLCIINWAREKTNHIVKQTIMY
jgi:hypothetical protein